MHSLHFLFLHIGRYGFKHKLLFLSSFMIFFWAVFDGILTYILPLKITEQGFSKTEMGIIIGSSSFAGALFDIILNKFLKNSHYRRLYLGILFFSVLFLLTLWLSKTLIIYLVAMSFWAFYWDLFNIGNLDFVSRTTPKDEHEVTVGVLNAFKAIGALTAPIIAGLVVVEVVGDEPFIFAFIFLALAAISYVLLHHFGGKRKGEFLNDSVTSTTKLTAHVGSWFKIGRKIFPILTLTLLMYINEAFFWTIGPLIAENMSSLGSFSGLFLTAYLVPALFIWFFVSSFSKRYEKNQSLMLHSSLVHYFSVYYPQ